jgi:hypothetical protein
MLKFLKDLLSYDWYLPHKTLVCFGVVWAAVWLIPNRQFPWVSFHFETAAVFWLLALAITLIYWTAGSQNARYFALASNTTQNPGFRVSRVFLAFLLICLPIVHWWAGTQDGSRAFLAASYIALIVLATVTGAVLQRLRKEFVLNTLSLGFLLGSFLSVGIQMAQFLGLLNQGIWGHLYFYIVQAEPGSRAYGNLGQPNLLAVYYLCAMASVFRLFALKKISSFNLTFVNIWLFVGLALTQSRMGMIGLLIFQIILFIQYRQKLFTKMKLNLFIPLIGICFVLAFIQIAPSVNEFLGFESSVRTLVKSSRQETRLTSYTAHLLGFPSIPLLGYGIDYSLDAFLGGAKFLQTDPQESFLHSHNFFLDYVAWFGAPLGIVVALVCYFALPRIRRIPEDAGSWLAWTWIAFYVCHSMVELPHYYTAPLIIVFLSLGYLVEKCAEQKLRSSTHNEEVQESESQHRVPEVSRRFTKTLNAPIQRRIYLAFVSLGIIYTAILTFDYLRLQDYYMEWRYEQNKVGTPPDIALPASFALDHVEKMIHLEKWRPTSGLSTAELAWVDATMRNQLSSVARMKAAQIYALNLQPEKAVQQMKNLNAMIPRTDIKDYRGAWIKFQQLHKTTAIPNWPPVRTAGIREN